MGWFPTQELRRRARMMTVRLQAAYGASAPHQQQASRLSTIDELVLTVLSQSTTNVNSWRGYQALKAQFATWDAAADAPAGEIEEAIRACGLSRQKAPRIKAMLERIRLEHGRLTLDFLAEMPPDEALAYLMSFTGVGRKTASCVLLFALEMPCMPVDTHIYRIALRTALIPAGTTVDQAHDLLEALLPEEDYLPFHVNMVAHGRQTCYARSPACERCSIVDCCEFGKGRGGVVEKNAFYEE